MSAADIDGRWRVFVSHTAELRGFPRGTSYVAAVEQAIKAAGHVAVDMREFPAADQPPAQLCVERVLGCEVYVGVLGTRYGSSVRDRPQVSYTELEFTTATQAGKDRLIFMLDTDADDVGIPPAQLIDRQFGERQDAFRARVQDSGLTRTSFTSPAQLGQLVERSLRELADTRRRLHSGLRGERIPAEPQPVRGSRFVNPPPAVAPSWFQDRQIETGLLARYVIDPGIRMVSVVGRGGIGKTAMVCRLLKLFEADHLPDVEGNLTDISVGGVVYLSRNGVHQVNYPTLVGDLLHLVPADAQRRLQHFYQDPQHTPSQVMRAVLEAFPLGEPVVVLLDNVESVMDTERETLTEDALGAAVRVVLTAPAHAVTVIVTTRVIPAGLLRVEPARQRQLRLEEGLGSPDAEIVLRELDDDGTLGLRDAPDELLDGLRAHTRGFPRALEAVKAILDGDRTLTPPDLLDRTRDLPEDQVVQVLVGEAYQLLDIPAQHVMQALAVYPSPVSAVGVDFLLRQVNPTTDAAPILTRLVRSQLVRSHNQHFHLHPVDRDYARSQLPPGAPDDHPDAFTLGALQTRAADYYTEIRTPRESWHGLDDIQPQLAEFELRCATGDFDTAAQVLFGIDFDYLQVWGHYRTLVDLHRRIHGRITDPALNADHLSNLGLSYATLGDCRRAIRLHSQALTIARETGNRDGESTNLGNLGVCHASLGDSRRAIELHSQALTIDRETGNRDGESATLGNLGNCHYRLGDYRRAIELYTQALTIARDTGNRNRNRIGESAALGNLGLCHASLGDYRQAIELHSQALTIDRETGNRDGESTNLGNLGLCHASLGDYRQAIELHSQALTIDRKTGNRDGESATLGNLGLCHASLGDYRQAIQLHTQALTIARDTGNRRLEANELGDLGQASLASGEADRAMALLSEALRVADSTGDIEPAVAARSGLALAQLWLADPEAALATTAAARAFPYPIEGPRLHLLAGVALHQLQRAEEARQAFGDALTTAQALLRVAERNVAAMQVRALALSGLDAVNGDPRRAAEALQAFTELHRVTTATGVFADSVLLLDAIGSHDLAAFLTDVVRATPQL